MPIKRHGVRQIQRHRAPLTDASRLLVMPFNYRPVQPSRFLAGGIRIQNRNPGTAENTNTNAHFEHFRRVEPLHDAASRKKCESPTNNRCRQVSAIPREPLGQR